MDALPDSLRGEPNPQCADSYIGTDCERCFKRPGILHDVKPGGGSEDGPVNPGALWVCQECCDEMRRKIGEAA